MTITDIVYGSLVKKWLYFLRSLCYNKAEYYVCQEDFREWKTIASCSSTICPDTEK